MKNITLLSPDSHLAIPEIIRFHVMSIQMIFWLRSQSARAIGNFLGRFV